jgi:hypothetical protein
MLAALRSITFLIVFASLYFIVGPLLLLIAVRIFLWLARVFDLANAAGEFGADVRRSYRAHARTLDREFGAGPG